MIIQIDNDEEIYGELMKLFYDIKLIEGPTGINATLRRHPQIKRYIHEIQINKIKDLENLINKE